MFGASSCSAEIAACARQLPRRKASLVCDVLDQECFAKSLDLADFACLFANV